MACRREAAIRHQIVQRLHGHRSGRGRPDQPSLVIFTEGNHLMVLLGEDIIGAFQVGTPSTGDLCITPRLGNGGI
jgi:hypothetical protein